MPKLSSDLQHLVRLGAAVRLRQLDQEQAAINAAFPALRRARGNGRLTSTAGGTGETAAPRKKRKMSAAGRAAIIAGAKKRWAAWRKAQKAGG